MERYCEARKVTENNKIGPTRFACWIPKATSTNSEYVVLIVFPLQQLLHKWASTFVIRKLPILLSHNFGLKVAGEQRSERKQNARNRVILKLILRFGQPIGFVKGFDF
jgi:hypothetical protein